MGYDYQDGHKLMVFFFDWRFTGDEGKSGIILTNKPLMFADSEGFQKIGNKRRQIINENAASTQAIRP